MRSISNIDLGGGGIGADQAIFRLLDQTLTFNNLVATISDARIDADDAVFVFYANDSLATQYGIVTSWTTGSITFTAASAPASSVVVTVYVIKPALANVWDAISASEVSYGNSTVAAALDGKVSKSGDTMTGNLTVTGSIHAGTHSDITGDLLLNSYVYEGTGPNPTSLEIGNSYTSGDGKSYGEILIHGASDRYGCTILTTDATDALGIDPKEVVFPDKSGTIALTDDLAASCIITLPTSGYTSGSVSVWGESLTLYSIVISTDKDGNPLTNFTSGMNEDYPINVSGSASDFAKLEFFDIGNNNVTFYMTAVPSTAFNVLIKEAI